MPRDDAGRDVGSRIELRVFRDQVDMADAFGMKLEGDLLRREFAVDMLAAGHRGRVVIEDLVGDVGARGDRLADREAAGVEIGAVAEIGEDVLLFREGRDADPGHALAAHMGEGLGRAVHPQRHEVAADAGEGAAAFRDLGRGVVGAAGAEIRGAGDGATACICVASRPLNQSALARSMFLISGLRSSRRSRSVSELASEATLSSAAKVRKRLSWSSILPTMRGRTSSRQLNSSCLTWFSTISRRSSTMKISSRPTANCRTPSGSSGQGMPIL